MRTLPQSLFFTACCCLLGTACGGTNSVDQSAVDGVLSSNLDQQPSGSVTCCLPTANDPCAIRCSSIVISPNDCGVPAGASRPAKASIPSQIWQGGTVYVPGDVIDPAKPTGKCSRWPGYTVSLDPLSCVFTSVADLDCGQAAGRCDFNGGTCTDYAFGALCDDSNGEGWKCNRACPVAATIKREVLCPPCETRAIKSVQHSAIVSTGGQAEWRHAYPGYVDYEVSGSGVVTATLDGKPFAQAIVRIDDTGGLTISGSGNPLPKAVGDRTIRFMLPPSTLGLDQNFAVHYESSIGASSSDEQQVVSTLLDRKTTLPPCNTFVREVSVTDGHLVQVAEDLKVAGRGGGLSFTRTYSSDASGEGPLGSGWTHNYRAFLIKVPGTFQYVVVGGEGNGQTFSCATGTCIPQPGYHGSLTVIGDGLSFVFRSKYGTRYEFGALVDDSFPSRHRLEQIVDAVGNVTRLEYEGSEVRRVWEAGGGRHLEFGYTSIPRHCLPSLVRLASVMLVEGGGGTTVAPIRFTYTSSDSGLPGLLETASRGERTETYKYVSNPNPNIATELETYKDPNGNLTTYAWDLMRVQSITDPTGAVTRYEYDLNSDSGGKATVTGPRPAAKAIYTVDQNGCLAQVDRSKTGGGLITTTAHYNDDHLLEWETDALGRKTTYAYDTLGNMEKRSVDPTNVTGVEPTTTDGDGNQIANAVETWRYDQTFSAVACHQDAEGYVTTNEIDSGTGLVTKSQRYRTKADPGTACRDASTGPGGDVEVTELQYCEVNGSCPENAQLGDLSAMVDGEQHTTSVTAVDSYGNPTSVTVGTLTVSRVYTYASLLESESDTLGHSTTWTYDELGRVKSVTKANTKGNNPLGLFSSYEYYPGGQLKTQTNGLGLSRSFTLDGMNRVATVIETGPGVAVEYDSSFGYDEAGNKTKAAIRGWHETIVEYDSLNRPINVTVGGKQSASYAYDDAGNQTSETDLHGHQTTYHFDALYRPVRIADPLGNESLRRYDLAGRLTYERDGNGHETRYTSDCAGRLTSTTDAVGHVEMRTYYHDGQLASVEEKSPGGVSYDRMEITGYDAQERPSGLQESGLGFTLPRQTIVYDDAAHTVASTDRNGVTTLRNLDDLDRPFVTTVDPGGLNLQTQFEYDNDGNLSAVIDALGRRTDSTYDCLDRLTERYLPMGVTEKFEYDGAGHQTAVVDRRGVRQEMTYDEHGRSLVNTLIRADGSNLALSTRAYVDTPDSATNNVAVKVSDARGKLTTIELDPLERIARLTDPLGYSSSTTYDAVNPVSSVDRNGNLTSWTYDAANRVLSRTDSDSETTYVGKIKYDDEALSATATDRNGVDTIVENDGLGRSTKVTRKARTGEPSVAKMTYDGNGNLTVLTDPNRNILRATYDNANRIATETRGAGTPAAETTTLTYDAVGNLLEIKGARPTGLPYDVIMSFDDLDRAVRIEDANGNVTSRAFDGLGNKLCESRPAAGALFGHGGASGASIDDLRSLVCSAANSSSWTYDEQSGLVAVTDGLGTTYRFAYDDAHNLTSKTDPNNHTTTYGYDDRNFRVSEMAPGGQIWTMTPDRNGNVRTVTNPNGQTVTNTWGLLDRVTRQTWSGNVSSESPAIRSIDYGYDGNGNLTTVSETKTSGIEQTSRIFDDYNRLRTETRSGATVSYGYDLKGNRTSVTDPGNVTTTYTYDALDRLSTVAIGQQVARYHYYPGSLFKGVDYPTSPQLQERRCYDAGGRLATAIVSKNGISVGPSGLDPNDCAPLGAPIASLTTYIYDVNGNRVMQMEERTDPTTQQPKPAEITAYAFDGIDRLLGIQYPDGRETAYNLDAVGNRIGERESTPGQAATPGLAATYEQLASYQLAHDVTAQFNENDWLTARTDAADPSRSTTFGYDGNGNQTSRTSAAGSRRLSWDARNTLTAVRDGSGRILGNYDYDYRGLRVWRNTQSESIDYVLDDRSVLQERDASKTGSPQIRRYHYGTNVLAVSESPGTAFVPGTSYVVSDGLGSASDFWTSSGTLSRARQFDAWGGYRNAAAPGSGEPKAGYTGHQYDPETGWVYARARYYDPTLGIFLSRDPFRAVISDVPSLHRYAYANGNPLRYTDPTGLQSAETMAQQQMMGMMWREVFAEVAGFFRGMFGGSAYISSDTSIHYSPPQGGVGGVVGGPVRVLSGGMVPIEENASPESLAGLVIGARYVAVVDPAQRLFSGLDAADMPTSGTAAALELAIDLLPYTVKPLRATALSRLETNAAQTAVRSRAGNAVIDLAMTDTGVWAAANTASTGALPVVGAPFALPPARSIVRYLEGPNALSRIAAETHLLGALRSNGLASRQGLQLTAVALAGVRLPSGARTVLAAGSAGTLSPAQRDLLMYYGVPEQNILWGAKYTRGFSRLQNHAERIIHRNLPAGAAVEDWGISWAGSQKPIPCGSCSPFVHGALQLEGAPTGIPSTTPTSTTSAADIEVSTGPVVRLNPGDDGPGVYWIKGLDKMSISAYSGGTPPTFSEQPGVTVEDSLGSPGTGEGSDGQ